MMISKKLAIAGLALTASMTIAATAQAQPQKTDSVSGASPVESWDQLVDTVRDLPTHLLTRLPESMRNDPRIRQEVARLALAGLTASALDALSMDGDHPFFLPQINMLLFAGQPNADTIYRFTQITPGGTYRITGTRGKIRIATIGEMSPRPIINGVDTVTPITSYHDINALKTDKDGRFSVILSPTRPEGYTGDWWPLSATTDRLHLRMVRSDLINEREPTIAIERVDAPANRPRPSAAEMENKLRRLARDTTFISSLFVDRPENLRKEGYNNKIKLADFSKMGGLVGQTYWEGPYELKDDEALIIEAKVPSSCQYRSIMVASDTYDYTVDWYNNQTRLNDSDSKPDPDGVIRFVLSAKDPGVPNWLDTAGYQRGLVQGRWTKCDTTPIPSTKKVPVSQVRQFLPATTPTITPQQRDQIIRERRIALQQRSLW